MEEGEGITSETRGFSNNLLKAGRVDSRIIGRTAEGIVVQDEEVVEVVSGVVETFRVSEEEVGVDVAVAER